MRMFLRTFAVVAVVTGVGACGQQGSGPATTGIPADAAARQAHEAYVSAINTNNLDLLLAMLTEDVVYIPPNEPALVGKVAVRPWAEKYLKAFKIHWEKTSLEFVVAGDWAFERYSYTLTDIPQGSGAAVEDTGKGLNIYHHDSDGKWRVARDAWSSDLPSRAHKVPMPMIGFLSSGSLAQQWTTPQVAAFRRGLNEAGYVEGKNVAIEFRWADGNYDRLPTLAADLVRKQVAVIVAAGGSQPALAAWAATPIIPIVFNGVGDPVELGLAFSIDRPGGNATGVAAVAYGLPLKYLDVLHEGVPDTTTIALLVSPDTVGVDGLAKAIHEHGRLLGLEVHVLRPRTDGEIDAAFATIVQLRAGALIVAANTFLYDKRDKIIELAARHALPAIYPLSAFVTAGGLMSYDHDGREDMRQVGILAGNILHGANPADLPIRKSGKFQLVINLKTAKALGLTIPQSLLLRADEVIQ